MAAERSAHAVWEGNLVEGHGQTSLTSSKAAGPLDVSWAARTEDVSGGKTSPEELIAAAHASCFSMALSHELAQGGATPKRIETDATATFGPAPGGGFHMSSMALRVRGEVDGIDEDGFRTAAENAKNNCPVSQALKGNVELSVDAALA
jgi:osmotically inducible protein OsmC